MLRRAIEVVRIIVISPEALIVMIIYAAYIYWIRPFEIVGQHFIQQDKLWEYIPAIPLGLLSFSVYLSFQVHAPVDSSNRELYDWHLYWALKYRIIAAMAWSGLSVLCSLAIWFFTSELSSGLLGLLFLTALTVSVVVAITEILALFTLKEILAK